MSIFISLTMETEPKEVWILRGAKELKVNNWLPLIIKDRLNITLNDFWN